MLYRVTKLTLSRYCLHNFQRPLPCALFATVSLRAQVEKKEKQNKQGIGGLPNTQPTLDGPKSQIWIACFPKWVVVKIMVPFWVP